MTQTKCMIFILCLCFCQKFGVSKDIKIYNIAKCNLNDLYPVTISNVNLEVKDRVTYVSGTLTAANTIIGPVKASLVVKKYIKPFHVWIEIPCVDNIGSCTVQDLCTYGEPLNKTCPEHFKRDNVPCRCPIAEGTYVMKPDNKVKLFEVPTYFELEDGKSNPATGIYAVRATVTDQNSLLACYHFSINYEEMDDVFVVNLI